MNIPLGDILHISEKTSRKFQIKSLNISVHLIFIEFESNQFQYNLTIYEKNGNWYPYSIGHLNRPKNFLCPYCDRSKPLTVCTKLKDRLDEVFEQIMNHPKVRLKKLFF